MGKNHKFTYEYIQKIMEDNKTNDINKIIDANK